MCMCVRVGVEWGSGIWGFIGLTTAVACAAEEGGDKTWTLVAGVEELCGSMRGV
jgi:hypothetical protein